MKFKYTHGYSPEKTIEVRLIGIIDGAYPYFILTTEDNLDYVATCLETKEGYIEASCSENF